MKAQRNKLKKLFLGFTTIITIGVFYLEVWQQTSRHFEKEKYNSVPSQIQEPIGI